MKKILAVITSFVILFAVAVAAIINSINQFDNAYALCSENATSFKDGIDVYYNNEYRDDKTTYLTNDKFIYVTEDTRSSNCFGTPQMLVIYDLLTGVSAPIEFCIDDSDKIIKTYVGSIDNIYVVDSEIYFTCYTDTSYDTEVNWGFCFCSYNVETQKFSKIYETPNATDDISVGVIENDFYLVVGDYHSPCNLYKYDTSSEKTELINTSAVNGTFSQIIYYDEKYIYLEAEKVHNNQEEIEILDEFYLKIDKSGYYEKTSEPKIKNNLFGYYKIEYTDSKIKGKEFENDCGYKYKRTYYLLNVNDKNKYELGISYDWYYYF